MRKNSAELQPQPQSSQSAQQHNNAQNTADHNKTMPSTFWPQAGEEDLPEDGLALFINGSTHAIAVTPTMAKRPCIGCAKCCTVFMLGSFHTHLEKCQKPQTPPTCGQALRQSKVSRRMMKRCTNIKGEHTSISFCYFCNIIIYTTA